MSLDKSLCLGWIGLGSMGLAMATNIQKYLIANDMPSLCYSNRTLSRGDSLQEIGGVPCQSVGELVQMCDVILISVSNDEVLKGIVKEILNSGDITGKIIVDTTTVHPTTSATISSQLQEAHASFIAAPVFGATPLAQAGKLLSAVAGPSNAIQKISPFLKGVIARNVIQVGHEPSKALLLKTTSNYITAGLMYLISEAHVFAEKSGLPADVLETLIGENFGAMALSDSQRMTQGIYYPAEGEKPYSDLGLGMKDVGIGLEIAKEKGMRLGVGELVWAAMEQARGFGERKGRQLDSSGMFGAVRTDAGLQFKTEGVKKRDGIE
ncbi:NAD binding domain of 6-phosphogluconate dehydrogenase-domain-containing protein [Lophiotrema nucula]|uniref:NAD binding domain of 6-phosphogluconate dehydrogenase-domain-containing protein n=1 Tax=Lophiotrema nucula TaxID=690887 RepID=A0A6A5ZQ44_9PLEO|nr:NAD binding domain of 6-phosphogluconate dehydrogenase-domain-containing protein [Lophiotrema nucula]